MPKKEIILKHGEAGRLAEAMNTTRPTVRLALRYQCNSDLSVRIRKVAKEQFGGQEVIYIGQKAK